MSKIITTFNYCSDSELVKQARRIANTMKENPLFPNPNPAVADLETGLQNFEVALSNAGGGERQMISIKNDKRALLRELLKSLSIHVTQVCKGDKTMLLGSGFEISADRNKPDLQIPRLKVELPLPGQAVTQIRKLAGARSYVHQYTADPVTPESAWIGETTISNRHTFTGLGSAARLWFRVTVISKKGESVYWEPVSRIIQ